MIDDRSSDELSIASDESNKNSKKKKKQKMASKNGEKEKKTKKMMLQQKKKSKLDTEDDDITDASENFASEQSETDNEENLKNHLEKKKWKSPEF